MRVLFMDYIYNLPNSTVGSDAIFKETMTVVPLFIPMLLLFIFAVVFLGGISRQKARSGFADYPMWSVVASLSIFLVSLILTLYDGLISLIQLTIVVVINIFSAIWLFLDRKASEI
jgi:CHASE2 domain-containing sensor protein